MADDPPYDDQHLLPIFPKEGRSENPLTVFCRDMPIPRDKDWGDLPRDFKELEKEKHQVALNAFLAEGAEKMVLVERLLGTDPSTWQWPEVDETMGPSSSWLYLTNAVLFANRLQRGKVTQLSWQGRHREAMEEAFNELRMSSSLEKPGGAAIHCLVTMSVHMMAERDLKNVLIQANDLALIEAAQRRLESHDVDPQSIANMLKVEWVFMKNGPKSVDTKIYDTWNLTTWQRLAVSYLSLDNRTMAHCGDYMTTMINGLSSGWTEGSRAMEDVKKSVRSLNVGHPTLLFRPNSGGKIALANSMLNVVMICQRSCGISALHRMTLISLAMRRFELAQGRVPERLEELVPAYLLAVPLDPYDGQPIRWNAQKQWLYSVGNNGVDDRGRHLHPDSPAGEDITVPYWWSDQAKLEAEAREKLRPLLHAKGKK